MKMSAATISNIFYKVTRIGMRQKRLTSEDLQSVICSENIN